MSSMKFGIRRDAVKAMIACQFPWIELSAIYVYDHTDWDEPHFKVEFVDDGKQRELTIKMEITEE